MMSQDMQDKIEEKKNEWEESTVGETLKKSPERKSEFRTHSDIAVQRLYTPVDAKAVDYLDDLGFPGEYPFTRGVQPTMYRGRLWTMRQYAGYANARESNRRFRYLLEQGQTGLSIAFDLPTQIGYDSDHPLAEGEVGKVGVVIDSLRDMEILFDEIPLDKVSTSMTINATAPILLAMYIVLARRHDIPEDKLTGTVQNDVLKEYVARGTHIFPVEPSMRLITDIFQYCSTNMPRWNMISISGYHIREAGSTAVQELAFTLADGIAYVEAARKAGLDVDKFASRLSFFFISHNNFLEEVAKFRVARRLWARIMRDRFGAKRDASCRLRFHTQTAGSTLTSQQYENNVVRVTLQALAAVLGGTQSLHTCSRDEALALPTEESVRISLRTQQIIACESGAADTIDPLGGSYYVETLTSEIEQAVNEYLERIDAMGGAIEAIKQGFIQREIQESAYKYQQEIESEENIVVGVNRYTIEEDVSPELLQVDPAVHQEQVNGLERLKKERDDAKVRSSLAELKKCAEGDENLMYPIIDCVDNYVTLGEICDTLRSVFGEYQDFEKF